MKNQLVRLLVPVLVIMGINACHPSSNAVVNDEMIVTGAFQNIADTTITLTYTEYALLSSSQTADLIIDSAGQFKLAISASNPARCFMSLGKVPKNYRFTITTVDGKDSTMGVGSFDFKPIFLYLQPGDSIYMTADFNNIEESLKFTGIGAENNTFVNLEENKFDDYKHKYLGNYYNLTYQEPDNFKQVTDELKKQKQAFMRNFAATHKLSNHLIKIYSTNYYQDAIRSKIFYPDGHAGFNDGVYPHLPDDYFSFMDSVEIPDTFDDLDKTSYYFLSSYLREKYKLAGSEKSGFNDFYSFAKAQLPERLGYVFYAYSLGRDFRKELYDAFGDDCPFPVIAALVKKKYQHLEGMLAGNPAPDFNLPDVNGKMISLKNLKGKLVYIDLWATWCGPCVKEIPFLQKLEKQLDPDKIAFVSISFDLAKDSTKWKSFVINKHLTGIQLLADKKHHDEFSNSLNIKTIPRFLLLDQDGKIIDANAKRPSDPRLKKLLLELVN